MTISGICKLAVEWEVGLALSPKFPVPDGGVLVHNAGDFKEAPGAIGVAFADGICRQRNWRGMKMKLSVKMGIAKSNREPTNPNKCTNLGAFVTARTGTVRFCGWQMEG
jgi:hypothetical protein